MTVTTVALNARASRLQLSIYIRKIILRFAQIVTRQGEDDHSQVFVLKRVGSVS
jgi:hypothetical protein